MRFLRIILKFFNNLRKFLHLIFLLVIAAVVLASFSAVDVRVPAAAALVIDPSGDLVEQYEGAPIDRALAELQGQRRTQTRVRDVTDSLEAAATDDRVRLVVLHLDDLGAGGMPKLRAIVAAIKTVQAAGKKVIAFGDSYSQAQYFLAAHADEVYLHELGMLLVDGFAYYRAYFQGALEKLKIDVNIFRAGRYKTAVEPFTRSDMSTEDKESAARWVGALWDIYKRDVAAARGIEAEQLDGYVNEFSSRLVAADGQAARAAVESGLVDFSVGRREFERRVGGDNDEFEKIDYLSYLNAIQSPAKAPQVANVGVIVASGQIIDGEAPPGTIGGDSLAALVAQAAEDESIDAVVLRVDSPGGSMFASEVVVDHLNEIKGRGKPLIISMSSMAASGGYYLAMPGDQIWADEATITGSIGVFAVVPTVNRALDALGVNIDGFGTTDLAGQLRLDIELNEDVREILQLSVEQAYDVFLSKFAAARGISDERAESLAAGRVWVGRDAYQLGLVDELGGLDEAIAAAAEQAGLSDSGYGVRYIEPQFGLREWLAMEFAVRARVLATRFGLTRDIDPAGDLTRRLLSRAEAELRRIGQFNDPRSLYYHCFCEFP